MIDCAEVSDESATLTVCERPGCGEFLAPELLKWCSKRCCNIMRCRAWRAANKERSRESDRKAGAKWLENNREQHKESVRSWRNRTRDWKMFYNAKKRAKAKGLEFNIDVSDIVIPDVCPVLGIALHAREGFRKRVFEDSPSLDRILPTVGYVKGNVRVISWRANRLKSNATLEELKLLVSYLQSLEAA